MTQDHTGPTIKFSAGKKLTLGAALIVLPLGVYQTLKHLARSAENTQGGLDQAFKYDTSALKQVDPKLIGYKELARIDPGLNSPSAISIDPAGNLLVAGNGLIKKFSPSGAFVSQTNVGGDVHALAAASGGTLYVAHRDHVEVISPDGSRASAWASPGSDSYLTCIAITPSDVYVADAGRRVILRYSPDGRLLNEIGRKDEARHIPGLIVPSPHLDVVVANDGLVWVGNPGMHRVEAYTPDGQLEAFWGEAGSGIDRFFGCCNPTDLAVLADGSFITAEKGLARIKRYLPDGRFDSIVAPPDAFGDNRQGLDIATNVKGQVMVLERGTKTIRIFAPIKEGA